MKTIFDLSSGEIVYYLRFKNGEYRSGIIGILLASPDQYSQFYQNKTKQKQEYFEMVVQDGHFSNYYYFSRISALAVISK